MVRILAMQRTVTTLKDDLISRQAALDALTCKFRITGKENAETVAAVIDDFNNRIKALPSAQPVNIAKLQPNCNQVASDCASDCASHCASDVISRQAAIETVRKAKDKSEAHRMLIQLPSAQPGWKKGKWIERNPQNSPDCRLIECSECGNAYIVGYSINYDDWIDGRNFCMKCGADLRGGSNGKST